MPACPTARDVVHREGTAELLRFRRPADAPAAGAGELPVLLIPSLINRWYVLDLRPGASLAGSLVADGHDVWCLDWGMPHDEDRHLGWDAVLDRLRRAISVVRRNTGAPAVGLLGYCIGGTLSGIHTALNPRDVAALVNLAGPFDFSHAGALGTMVDPRWFDPEAIANAGNVSATQMQSGFVALRPTLQIAKWVGFLDRAHDPASRAAFKSLEEWSSDNIPFPAAAYATYIRELYQENRLVAGTHHVRGRRVDLGNITCPVLSITTDRDNICPPPAAVALNERSRARHREVISVPGGHVGAVVGGKAARTLYPAISRFFREHARSEACNSAN